MTKRIGRALAHLLFRQGRFKRKCIARLARRTRGKRILELGSGLPRDGRYPYSVVGLFDASNELIQSDINPAFGHRVVDVTNMAEKDEYDIVLCLNVLEHVFDFRAAIRNLREAVKPGGLVVVMVPAFYPLHDEPADYWRFTEHALRKLFDDFDDVTLARSGPRPYPFGYYVEATRPSSTGGT